MNRALALCGLLGMCFLAGCSGGGSPLVGATSGSRAVVLVTDSFREEYAHVWATIYRVEIIPQSGSPVVLFDDPNGHQIDLKTLRDAGGQRFSFLGSASIPEGTYTGINITIGPTMQLFRNGIAVGDPLAVDSALPTDASGRPILSLTFANPKRVGTGTTHLILDFDLARFIVRNSKVLPALKEGTLEGLHNFARHNQGQYRGTVSSLIGTAPDLTFTLTRRDGTTVTVTTSAATALYGSATLANGAAVEIRGTLDTTTQALVATHLEVLGASISLNPRAFGIASYLDAAVGTFTLTVQSACMFLPGRTTIQVVTDTATIYRADDGSALSKAAFFTALAANSTVSVEGTYDSASSTLTASALKIVDPSQDGNWHRGSNRFRRGADRSNWGHGVFH